jgi:predicted alpha-1,2-mannosidase
MRGLRAALAASALLLTATEAAAAAEDLTAYVDPLIGTGGDGHVFPGATLPFGMVQLSPSTDGQEWKWASGYHYSGDTIHGFAHTHISGAGLSALGDILLMPARGPSTRGALSDGYWSHFSHQREQASPGYYRVHLDGPDVDAELTAGLRAGFHRYTFRGAGDRYLIVDPTHGIGDRAYATGLEIVSDREIRGYRRSLSQSTGDRAVYFVARFSRPFLRASLTENDAAIPGTAREGPAIKAFVQFASGGTDQVEVAVAISHTGYAGAEANFGAEARGRTFDRARAAAHDAWQDWLSRITIEEPSLPKKRIFYTAEYHAGIAPNLISDVTGDYYLEGKVRHSGIPQFSNFSNWDTYRALHPLLTIIAPRKDGEIVASMVSRHSEQGMPLPIWEGAGHDNRVMIGYSIVSPIADAVLKGLPGVDPAAAYAAIRASAFDRTKHSNVYDANGMDGYLAYSFVPAEVGSSVSKTTEQNYEDWAIGQVAAKLGKTADAALFAARATGYRQLYDPRSGDLLPRLADGRFAPMRLDHWDDLNRHYVSGNIWAYSAYAPHDMAAAIRLHGGREAYARWLDGIFTDQRPITGQQHVDLSGFIGRYGHGDEPSHEMAYLFNLAGQPWQTQSYVNRIVREMYSDRPDGLVNNEDLGQMSAWYIFSTLGLYPVAPGDLTYQIGAPFYRRATIAVGAGKTFTVEAEGLSDRNIYVQSATLNGQPFSRSYIRHGAILAGGALRFVMGPEPNREWASRPADTSLGAFDDKAPVSLPARKPWAPFDPDNATLFATARTIALWAEPGATIRYTIDGSTPGPGSRIYSRPIRIDRDAMVKAIAIDKRGSSSAFEKQYLRTLTAALPAGYPKIALAQSGIGYGAADGSMLIDGVLGTRFYGDRKWTGRVGDITATLDLGSRQSVRSVSLGYLDDPMNGILPPRRVELWGGDSPDTLRLLATRNIVASPAIRQAADRVRLDIRSAPHRYFQLRAMSAGAMPPRLRAAGRAAWLFLDEIILK